MTVIYGHSGSALLEHVPWMDNEGRKKVKEVKIYWVEEKKY